MTGLWKTRKPLSNGRGERRNPAVGFPTFPPVPWKSLRDSHIPTSPYDYYPFIPKGTFLLG